MKSQAMKTAWLLFKKYEMTFSQALIEAWKSVKRDFLRIEFETASANEKQSLFFRFNSISKKIFYPVRQSVKDECQKQHELSQENTSKYMSKFGYKSWMQ